MSFVQRFVIAGSLLACLSQAAPVTSASSHLRGGNKKISKSDTCTNSLLPIYISTSLQTAVPPGFCTSYEGLNGLASGSAGAYEIVSVSPDLTNYGFHDAYVYDGAVSPYPELSTSEFNQWIAQSRSNNNQPLPPDFLYDPSNPLGFFPNIGERIVVASNLCFWKSTEASYLTCTPETAPPSGPGQSTGCIDFIEYGDSNFKESDDAFSPIPQYYWASIGATGCVISYLNPNPPLGILNGISPSSAPQAGDVFIAVASQCFSYIYSPGTTYIQVTDPWNNQYIMHATNFQVPNNDLTQFFSENNPAYYQPGDPTANPPVSSTQLTLPEGWTISAQTVGDEPLYVNPLTSFESDGSPNPLAYYCYYIILRDNMGNGYHQVTYGSHISYGVGSGTPAAGCDFFSPAMISNECLAITTALPGFVL